MLCLGNTVFGIVVGRKLFHRRFQLSDFRLLLGQGSLKFVGMFQLRRFFRLLPFSFFGNKLGFQLRDARIALSGLRLGVLLRLGNRKLHLLRVLGLQHPFALSHFLVELGSADLP